MGLLLLAAFGYGSWFGVQIWWWRDHDPAPTAFMARRLAAMQAEHPEAALKHRWVPYSRISAPLKRAVIAAEDTKFVNHRGFDWDGIWYALKRNVREKEIVAGGSTISQQLAKNLFLSGERSLLRKAHEAGLTLLVEALLDKRRILEIYLNVAEWGDGVFGAEAAARHHFSVSASALDTDQAARLAVMLPRPRHYDHQGATPALEQRTAVIRRRLQRVHIP